MAGVFTLSDTTVFFSEKPLISHASLTISDGDRLGVVGRNGQGKSTLLRLLAGEVPPDGGEVTSRRGLSVTWLPQTPVFPAGATLTEAAVACMGGPEHGKEGAAYEAQKLLTELGFRDLHAPAETLSGGERMKVALAGALCRPCDVLMLDEPTNHLDMETSQWLEDRLLAWRGTLLVVTHDRYLLERVFTGILEANGGRVTRYNCRYAGYLEERAQREEMREATLRKQQSLYRRELSWIRAGAPARSTKAKGRIQRFEELARAVAPAPREQTLSVRSAASRLGRKILAWENLAAGYDEKPLVRDFTYTLLRDDRLGIVGPNGSGKTTLLRVLAGELPPLAGTLEAGETVKIGYFAQHCPPLDPDCRVIDAVTDVAVRIRLPEGDVSATQMAEHFLFPSAMQYQRVSSLSGGELRRLHLLRVLMTAPNVLILDEPTNDLDLDTLTVLEDYLEDFPGAIIAVSHDRFFLDRITRHLFAIGEGRMEPFIGGCQSWLDALAEKNAEARPAPPEKKEKKQRAPGSDDLRFTFREQRDLETIDDTLAALQARLEEIDAALAAQASDYVAVSALMAEQEETRKRLAEAEERWLYLQEKKERIEQSCGGGRR
ncbi:MAG: ABC-F family ATP-binding cassette domain-containing protein [Clostridia bacterium]|nr:ABC-F family ATP-binding cassette domain-containing protein [Clostridia bacterium]